MAFTEEQKQTLVAEYEALPEGERRAWLVKRKLSIPWFFRWQKQYGAQHQPRKHPQQKTVPVVKVAKEKRIISSEGRKRIVEGQLKRWENARAAGLSGHAATGGGKFRNADRETKRKLLAEYDSLPFEELAPWRKKHGLSSGALLVYYRAAFRKEDAKKAVVPVSSTNGHQPKAAAPAAPDFHPAHILPAATPGPTITLEDGIAAMQVRIDIYNEVLEHLRRMARGAR